MLWKMEYSHYTVESDFEHGKEKILKKALQTLQRFPYIRGDLYKYIESKGDEKVYVATYEFDVRGWNAGKPPALRKGTKI